MTSLERVRIALQHRAPDRIPIDFGSTAVTGMHVSCVAALRDRLGLARGPVKVHEPYQMLGWLEEDLRAALGIDVVGLFPRKTLFGFANDGWREVRMPWGQVVLVPDGFRTTTAPNGDLLIYPQGDPTVPPSGHMPVNGYFFDTIVRQEPIDDDHLDVADNLEEFGPVSEADLRYLEQAAADAAATGQAVVAGLPGTALGDIALVPAPFLKHPKGIRDIEEWYVSLASRREYVEEIFKRQTAIALANLPRLAQALGDKVDVVFLCGTDFGTQTSSFCSTQTFDEMFAPYYRQVNDWIHRQTGWKTFKHSCGAVEPFLGHFAECGFDIVNPVQCSATGMDPRHLKDRYGDRLTFWGGGVDTQHVLPFGTPAEVRAQVLERCRIFGAHGGFVFDAIHNVQARTPVENILAMFNAVREFNGEPPVLP